MPRVFLGCSTELLEKKTEISQRNREKENEKELVGSSRLVVGAEKE